MLLSRSPYLSAEILADIANNTTAFPHAVALEILMANSDALNDPLFVDYLGTKSNPMPEYMIDLLLNYAPNSSERTTMEKNLGEKQTVHAATISEALWAMMDYDDGTYTEEDFDNIIANIGTLNTEIATVEALLNKGDIAGANARLADIPNAVPFGKGDQKQYDAYTLWYTWQTDLMANERTFETMTLADIAGLEAIVVLMDTYASVAAMEVLNEYAEGNYFVPPAFGAVGELRRARTKEESLSPIAMEVYPNPADYMTTILLKQPLPTTESCQLMVTDLLGNMIYNATINPALMQYQINTKNWASGMYLFKITIPNSEITLNGKFDVLH